MNFNSQTERYIFLDSTNRNRNLYPNPASFVLDTNPPSSVFDPVSTSVPIFNGTLGGAVTGGVTTTINVVTTPSNIVNRYLRLLNGSSNDFCKIISVTTTTVTVETAPTNSYLVGSVWEIVTSIPIVSFQQLTASGSNNTAFISNSISLSQQDLLNCYIFFLSSNQSAKILAAAVQGSNYLLSFSSLPFSTVIGDRYDLNLISYDNSKPISSTYSDEKGEDLYQIDLVQLYVPNTLLNTGYGGTIYNYPCLLIKFENYNRNEKTLATNSPLVQQCQFTIPTNDKNSNNVLRLTYSYVSQNMYFRFTDAVRFEIYLPTGDLLSFAQSDNMSPLTPVRDLQIQALFRLVRIR